MRPLPIALVLTLLTCVTAAAPEPTRETFLKLLDRPRVDPAVQSNNDGSRFSFMSEKDERVPALLVKPTTQPAGAAQQRRPVVIALHGTGGTKESQLPLLRALAERGFLAVAIDARHHGERTKAGKGSEEYQQAILRAWREAGREGTREDAQSTRRTFPFFYDTVWDVMRLIDYLETRDDVDPKRIGLIGTSKGGIETYLAAAADERIAAAVPCVGVQSFRWALEHNAWQSRIGTIRSAFDTAAKEAGVAAPGATFVAKFYDRVAPGLAGEFDGPAMLPLIAPRPLLVINGDSDDRTPLPGVKLCTDPAKAAYAKDGADKRFTVRIQANTGHKVTPESQQAAIEWLARWLIDEPTRIREARMAITRLETALDAFEIDTGRFPSTKEGLAPLATRLEGFPNWHGPYVKHNKVEQDPWGRPYVYDHPGRHNPRGFDLSSAGPDGQAGTADDVTNWR